MTDSLPQLLHQASASYRAGDLAQSERLCNAILAQESENAEALHLLGLIASHRGHPNAALGFLERAVEANPLSPTYRTNLGVVLEQLNRHEQAAATYRHALEIQPDFIDAQINLAIALTKLRKFDDAAAAWRAAIDLQPNDPQLHNSLGDALFNARHLESAPFEFATAIELKPDFAEAFNNVGSALVLRGDLELAVVAYRKAVSLKPDLLDTFNNLAQALLRLGRPEEAAAARARIAGLRLDHAPTQITSGDAFREMGLWDAAIDSYRRAVQLDPQNAVALTRLGSALLRKNDLDGAVAAYRHALKIDPNSIEALNNLGIALKDQGLIDEALDCCEAAMNVEPNNAAVHSNLIYGIEFHPGYDAVEQSRQQRRFNTRHAEPLHRYILPHSNNRDPDRKLNIGYVSPDLCQHVVGQNLLPLLMEHDHAQFAVHCYSSVPRPDAITEILRRHTDVWRDVAALDDAKVADIIREDAIDILVDLSLHMGGNRLLAFARKPAPVQLTYLGYCASTGLDAIDFRFSDPYLDPPETDLSVYAEQTIRLPETYWCYNSAGPTPEPAPPPSAEAGLITFGCLNNFAKVSPGALDLWAEILSAVPNSRLIIHSYPGSHTAAVRQRFQAAGVSPDRLEFLAKQPWSHYIRTYHRIDIALDPFPYGGGITTCDALWMGVPVVTLAGNTAVGRGGKSILSNLNLPELIARRPRQYLQIATTLAQSPARLRELRSQLRPRMLTSPLMNARRFARNVEAAYRQMWKHWALRQ